MSEKEQSVNVTFTLPASIVEWLDKKVVSDDKNRSQVARKIFREAKEADEFKPEIKKEEQ